MSHGFATAWFTFALVADTFASSTRSSVRLVNNGYEGLLVAIAETVPDSQSATAVERIKVVAKLPGVIAHKTLHCVKVYDFTITNASYELL